MIDELTAAELKAAAWEDALDRILGDAGHDGADLIAQVGEAALRGAVLGWWEAQRSAGEVHPQLPTPITGDEDVRAAVRGLRRASEELAAAVEEIRNPARPSKRLIETLETVEQIEREADAIEQLVARPPVRARDAARATAALELPKVPGGPPLGTDHPARVQFFAARELVARRLVSSLRAARGDRRGARALLLGGLRAPQARRRVPRPRRPRAGGPAAAA